MGMVAVASHSPRWKSHVSLLDCYFLSVLISVFHLWSKDDAHHKWLRFRKAIHAVAGMPSTELASIAVHFFPFQSPSYTGNGTVSKSVTRYIPEAHLAEVGAPKFAEEPAWGGASWGALSRHYESRGGDAVLRSV